MLQSFILSNSFWLKKTLITQILVIYTILLDCNVALTSPSVEWAMLSRWQQLYLLFSMNSKSENYSHSLIENNNLIKNVVKNKSNSISLSQINILVIEEIGLSSSQLYPVSNLAIQYLMMYNIKIGGKLVILNRDHF